MKKDEMNDNTENDPLDALSEYCRKGQQIMAGNRRATDEEMLALLALMGMILGHDISDDDPDPDNP